MAAQARELHENLHEDAERVADGQEKEGEARLRADEKRVGDERRRADDVVEDRGGVAPEIVPLGVEDARGDAREAVEHDLDGEEPEQHDRVGHRRLVGARGLHPDERFGEDQAEHEADAEDDEQQREQVRDVGVGALAAQTLLDVEVNGQEGSDDHTADDELVELVRQVVRDRVAAGEQRRAEGERLAPGPHEAGDAAEDDEDAHHRRGAADVGLPFLRRVGLYGLFGLVRRAGLARHLEVLRHCSPSESNSTVGEFTAMRAPAGLFHRKRRKPAGAEGRCVTDASAAARPARRRARRG